MPAPAEPIVPAAGQVWDFNGRNVRLLRPHQHDSLVWIAEDPSNASMHYIGVPWMQENPERLREAAPTQATAPVPAPAPTRTESVEAQVVRSVVDEDPLEDDSPVEVEDPECPICHQRYHGTLGTNHVCDGIRRIMCLSCRAVNLAHVQHPLRPPYLCSTCLRAGVFVCKKCGEVTRQSEVPGICDGCNLVPESSIWRALRGSAFGSSVIQETRSHRPYSVEVECFLLPAARVVPYSLPGEGWSKVGDGSIRGDPGCGETAEFRSPPFCGDGGLALLHAAVKKIREMGYRANRTCGLHVHIDAIDCDVTDRNMVRKFCQWIERDVFKLVARNRPSCGYCNALEGISTRGDRYRWLNTEPAWTAHKTLEIRLHHGTTQPDRTVEWVKVCLAIVEMGLRYGVLPLRPSKSLFDLLGFTQFQRNYWLNVAKSLHGDDVSLEVR